MKRVADHLSLKARSEHADLDLCEEYTRSAFSRYYYALFWLCRDFYLELFPGTEVPNHKSLPAALKGKVARSLIDRTEAASRAGVLGVGEERRIKSQFRTHISRFAELLETGYELRRAADYDHDVEFEANDGGEPTLEQHKISESASWVESANALLAVIRRLVNRIDA